MKNNDELVIERLNEFREALISLNEPSEYQEMINLTDLLLSDINYRVAFLKVMVFLAVSIPPLWNMTVENVKIGQLAAYLIKRIAEDENNPQK